MRIPQKDEFLAFCADLLTLTRGLGIPLALIILWAMEVRSFIILLILLTGGWLSDVFDGKLARLARKTTKIGENEIYFDTLMLIACMRYISWALFLPKFCVGLLWFVFFIFAFSAIVAYLYKTPSFIFATEPWIAGALTLAVFLYVFLNDLLYKGSIAAASITALDVFFLIVFLENGISAKKRVREKLSTLWEDVRRHLHPS